MHLTKELIKEILPVLQRFVDTGEINENAKLSEGKAWRNKIEKGELKIKNENQ